MFDLVFQHGLLIDPKNQISEQLNIGIKDGKVAAISRDLLQGIRVCDVSGCVVSPGFVDIHIHEGDWHRDTDHVDFSIFDAMLRMGVTTTIGGNCGVGPADPLAYFDRVKGNLPINLAMLVPHGRLREVAGQKDCYRPLSAEALNRVEELLHSYLSQGLFGVSLGVRYFPGVNQQELDVISRVVAQHDGILASHLRDDAAQVFSALEEMLMLARNHTVSIQISHLGSMAGYGQMKEILHMLESAKEEGIDVGIDCYPYAAFSTQIGTTTYDDGFLERYHAGYESIEIAEGPFAGQRCNQELFAQLRKENPDTLTVGHFMKAEEIELALAHPQVLIASDGILHNGQGHPRAAGTFPRVLSKYVREKSRLTLDEALKKMTWDAAQRFGLDRGHLSLHSTADITIFDPLHIEDRATFINPVAPPEGITYVVVNGQIALEKGALADQRQGKILMKS